MKADEIVRPMSHDPRPQPPEGPPNRTTSEHGRAPRSARDRSEDREHSSFWRLFCDRRRD